MSTEAIPYPYTAQQVADLKAQQFAHLLVLEEGHVLTVRLNRPEKKNALNPLILQELAFALTYAHFTDAIRVVVLAAEGNVFCSGADLNAFMASSEPSVSTIPLPTGEILLAELFRHTHKPIIAQVEGDVFAGGFLLLANCNYVVAADAIQLGLPEVKRGLFPFQVMASLLEIMPARKVMDWCIRGGNLPVAEAMAHGLVTHACPVAEVTAMVAQLAQEIAQNSPQAIRLGLEAFDRLRSTPAAEQHAYLQGMLMRAFQSADAREGIAAFKEKRKPQWP
jgi:enoyl-CoA hydratase/carnithine racemase